MSDPPRLTGAQLRAARALLDWSAADLARASRVSPATIQRLERVQGVSPLAQQRTLADLRRALEAGGVLFVGSARDRPGVRLMGLRRGLAARPGDAQTREDDHGVTSRQASS